MRILVLNAHALHVGYLGCFGNEWIDTPHIDRLAAGAVVFDRHYADNLGNETTESGCLTGRYDFPRPEGVAARRDEQQLDLWSILKENNVPFRRIVLGVARRERGTTLLEGSLRQALADLGRLKSQKRWLAWVDLPSLAPPWELPDEVLAHYFPEMTDEDEEPLRAWLDPPSGPLDPSDMSAFERLQNTYAAAVSHFDGALGAFLDELEERSLAQEIVVCLTSRRGLNLGEHGIIGPCRPWLHEELTHLPLIVRLPQGAEASRRVFGVTQPVDLLPTLLEAFEVSAPSWLHGHGLWRLIRGETEEARPYACTGMRVGESIEWSLRTPEWASILPAHFAADDALRKPQLYVKPDDRWEVNNVRQHHLELAERLEQVLRDFVIATSQAGPLHAPALLDVEAAASETIADNSGDQA